MHAIAHRPIGVLTSVSALMCARGEGGGEGAGGVCVRVGSVGSLQFKPVRGSPMTHVDRLTLLAMEGIEGDAHAYSLSPRQVLLQARVGTHALDRDAKPLAPGRLGENIFIEALGGGGDGGSDGGDGGGAIRDDGSWWPPPSGSVLRLGDGGASLRVTFPCEPCETGVTRAGVESSRAFRDWKEQATRGLLATVVSGGEVRRGDEVTMLITPKSATPPSCVTDDRPPALVEFAPAFAQTVKERATQLLGFVPRGRVVTYTALCGYAGAHPPSLYARVVPSILRDRADELPVWRVVDSRRRVVTAHVPTQQEQLRGEGVRVSDKGEVEEDALWQPTHAELYLRPAPGE